MRKSLSFFLAFFLFLQPLAIPASVLAQTPTPNLSPPTSNYTYDSSGNLLDDGTRVITWDVEGKPVRVIKGDLETTFLYDSSGGRIGKLVKDKNTGTLQSATIYFGGNLEKELNPDGTTKSTARYYFAGGKRIAQRKSVNSQQITDNSQSGATTEELLFIHSDHLSSSTLFTDNQGNKKDSLITYYPYGETRTGWDLSSTSNLQPQTSNYLYTSQIKDSETDLYYYNARYYNQKTGLFISADTAGDSLNKYAYANNSPIMFNDPTGHMEQDLGGGGLWFPPPPVPQTPIGAIDIYYPTLKSGELPIKPVPRYLTKGNRLYITEEINSYPYYSPELINVNDYINAAEAGMPYRVSENLARYGNSLPFEKYNAANPQIVVEGPEEFREKVKDSLEILKANIPEAYFFILSNLTVVKPLNPSDSIYKNGTYDYVIDETCLDPSMGPADIILSLNHEAAHAWQKAQVVGGKDLNFFKPTARIEGFFYSLTVRYPNRDFYEAEAELHGGIYTPYPFGWDSSLLNTIELQKRLRGKY